MLFKKKCDLNVMNDFGIQMFCMLKSIPSCDNNS